MTHVQLNDARRVYEWHDITVISFGAMMEPIQSPLADRQEAAHYVHDNGLSTKDLEEWL